MGDEEATYSNYWKHAPLFWAYSILMFLPIMLVFVFFNYYSLDFLAYARGILLAFSVAIIWLAGGEFRKRCGAPRVESIVHTIVLVDSGTYTVARYPQYLGFIPFLALFIMSHHRLSVFWSIGVCYLLQGYIERRADVERFGDDYKRYLERIPRMNFLIGIIRLLRRRGKQSKIGAIKEPEVRL